MTLYLQKSRQRGDVMMKREGDRYLEMKSICLFVVMILGLIVVNSCTSGNSAEELNSDPAATNYRQEMRSFVQAISAYAKSIDTDFIVIPQNGHDLMTTTGDETAPAVTDYLSAIDGVGREDLYYGFDTDDVATPAEDRDFMIAFMDIAEANSVEALVTDYCSTQSFMDLSYSQSNARSYISFAADHRELDNIPSYPAGPYNENSDDISSLAEAQNFLYLLNPGTDFADKSAYLAAITATNYDVVIIDLYYAGTALTSGEVASLQTKNNGGTRLVIAYMSIGEAEDYRYYWQLAWNTSAPSWLAAENPNWLGNFKVRYWYTDWQAIIYGNDSSYLKLITDAGFDGVYLDIIDAYEYFMGI